MRKNQWLSIFDSSNVWSIAAVPLFYALFVVFLFVSAANFSFPDITRGMIGTATLYNLDVSDRVNLFYQSAGLFLILVLLFASITLLARYLLPNKQVWTALNRLAVAGIFILAFQALGAAVFDAIQFIIVLHLLLFLYLPGRWLFPRQEPESPLPIVAGWLTFAYSFTFLAAELGQMLNTPGWSFIKTFAALSMVIYPFIILLKPASIHRLFYQHAPFVLLPLLTFGATEIAFIAHDYSPSISRSLIYFILLGVLAGWHFLRIYRHKQLEFDHDSTQRLLWRFLFPWGLLGAAIIVLYQPLIPQQPELFELGNKILAVQQFYEFGRIPFLESFNSHLASEFIPAFIHTFIHGFNGLEMISYDFMLNAIYWVLCYWVLLKILKNGYAALLISLLFPLMNKLMAFYLAPAFLTLLILPHFLKKPSFKNALLLTANTILLVLWRIDIGYPNLWGTILVLVIFSVISPPVRQSWGNLLKASGIWIGLMALIILPIAIVKQIDIINNAREGLQYFSSPQSYGYLGLSSSEGISFKMHYFIFPGMVLTIASYLLFRIKHFISKDGSFHVASILFLSVFYFINFQRGLIRHSHLEYWDVAVVSFALLILAWFLWLQLSDRSTTLKLSAFIAIPALLVYGFSFPETGRVQNLMARLHNTFYNYSKFTPSELDNTYSTKPSFAQHHFNDLDRFLKNKIKDSATFYDFTNTPMLYWYLHRENPSYFNQNVLSTHDRWLQQNFVEEMKQGDIEVPVALHSHIPPIYWDAVDQVPNNLRHYIIAEYIFRNYSATAIIDGKSVFTADSIRIAHGASTLWRSDFEKYTYTKHKASDSIIPKFAVNKTNLTLKAAGNYSHKKDLVLEAWYDTSTTTKGSIQWKDEDGKALGDTPLIFDEVNNKCYAYLDGEAPATLGDIHLTMEGKTILDSVVIKSYEVAPDFYSRIPKTYTLEHLPHLWESTFPETAQKVTTQLATKPDQVITRDSITTIPVAATTNIEKQEGNFVLLKIRNWTGKGQKALLMYADKNGNRLGAFEFIVLPNKQPNNHWVRVSTQWNWWNNEIGSLSLRMKSEGTLTLKELKITSGK